MSADYTKVERSTEIHIADGIADHETDVKLEVTGASNDAPAPKPGVFARLFGKKSKTDDKKDDGPPPVPVLQLFRFATAQDRLLILIGTLCGIGMGATQSLMAVVFGSIVDNFNAYIAHMAAGRKDLADEAVNDAISDKCLKFAMIGVGALILSFGLFVCYSIAADRQCRRVRELYYQAILRQEMGWFDDVASGELTTRISGDINLINEGIAEKFGFIFQNITQFVGGFILAFCYSWRLTLVLMAGLPFLGIGGGILAKMLSNDASESQGAYAQAGAIATETLSSIKTVMAFGSQERELKRFDDKIGIAYMANIRKAVITGAGLGFMIFVVFSMDALGFWYSARLITDYGTTIGDVMVVFF
ncbi:hypothetical protein GQ42DRAFT_122675, partial [Ramicandelaber brevisporus]